MVKVLVVCSRNKKRSLTAEKIYRNDPRVEVRSVGTSPSARRKIQKSDIKWAEVILFMEKKHRQIMEQLFGKDTLPSSIVLDIEDEFEYMDQELIEMLRREIEDIIKSGIRS